MSSKFCPGCGTAVQQGKKFCASCGAPLPADDAAPAGAFQPAPQPAYQQRPAAQPAYQPPLSPAPAPGYYQQPQVAVKKRKIWPFVLGGIAGFIGLIIVIAVVAINSTASADYYKLGKDKIPSIKMVVDKRSVGETGASTSGGVSTKTIAYIDVEEPTDDLTTYVHHLIDNEGFIATADYIPSNIPGSTQLAKESVDDGKIIMLDIEYDENGYTLVFSKGKGTLSYD